MSYVIAAMFANPCGWILIIGVSIRNGKKNVGKGKRLPIKLNEMGQQILYSSPYVMVIEGREKGDQSKSLPLSRSPKDLHKNGVISTSSTPLPASSVALVSCQAKIDVS